MEIFLYSTIIILLALGAFVFFEKPYYLVVPLVFMMIYRFNISIPGPLDLRGLFLFLLFIRIVLLEKNNLTILIKKVLTNPFFLLVAIFVLMMSIVTYFNEPNLKPIVKLSLLSIVSMLMGFHIISNEVGRKAFIIGIIVSGILSVADLGIHYWHFGGVSDSLNLIRPLDLISSGKAKYSNHNAPGMLAGLAFLTVYILHKKEIWSRITTYSLLTILISGVFLSTSRSTILAVVVVLFVINFYSSSSTINIRKIIVTTFLIIIFYSSFYFVYNIFFDRNKQKKDLVNVIYYRLYEEPFEVLGLGSKQFDKYSGKSKEGSIKFRFEKASHDINEFFSKNLVTIVFGYGKGGYKHIGERRFINQGTYSYILEAHNGYTTILIENGLLGLLIFLFFSIALIRKSIKLQRDSESVPIGYIFLALSIYTIAQNGELTSTLAFLLIGGMISDVVTPYYYDDEELDDEDEIIEEFEKH